MKNINNTIFYLSTVIMGLLLIPSFLAAWGEDEGTLGTNFVWIIFAKLFDILRFPTHTLLWTLIIKGGALAFIGGLILNCMFYGFSIERIIYYIRYCRKYNSN